MLDLDTRTAILRLHREGHGTKKIAKALRVSRNSVRKVLRQGEATVPSLRREEQLAPQLERIRELHGTCGGNLVRVAEELEAEGIEVRYSTLTGFCRRHGIGEKRKKRAGRYHFAPGEEMQHDTSPHDVKVGGRLRRLQCASVILCYSRLRFVQCYPRFDRFHCRLFLDQALRYFGAVAGRCMVDNSNLVVLRGTGANAVMVPEMVAFAERYGFTFVAHEKGDANRSGRVERGFDYIEKNFYPGRTFSSIADLNDQARAWCDKVNAKWTRTLSATPRELFVAERPALASLPLHLPEVYDLHFRRVDVEGYVCLHTNRYSVDEELIGRRMSVHETGERVRIFDGHRLVAEHDKGESGARKRVTLPEHRYTSRRRRSPEPPVPEEQVLRSASPELGLLVDALRQRQGGRAARAVQRLHRLYVDYPTEAVVAATARALEFGLLDLERLERMVLERIAGDFFRLPIPPSIPEEPDHG